MKKLYPAFVLITFSFCATAQDVKPKVSAKPTEQQEIIADNHLKKTIQQKELSKPPEKIIETSSQATTKKVATKKKRSCCTKKQNKA